MDIKLPFGLRDGKVIHISEIPIEQKGLKCNCICPVCKERLIARLGNIKVHHFAHNNEKCVNALETALHYYAKEVLLKNNKIKLPALNLEFRDFLNSQDYWDYIDYKKALDSTTKIIDYAPFTGEAEIEYDRVESELVLDGIRPDIVLYRNNVPLLVEIAVTHFVDEEKLRKIRSLGKSTIEINLSPEVVDYYNFDKENIEKLIIDLVEYKKWIYNRKAEEEKAKLVREIKAFNKREETRHKKIQEIKEKKYQERVERIKKLINEEHSTKYKDYKSSAAINKLFYSISKELGITLNTIPEFLNIKVDGELAINCDRRIWQSSLYYNFIKNRVGKSFKIVDIINWFKKSSELPLNKDLIYTKDIKELKVCDLTDAIYNYLAVLEEYGIVEFVILTHKYYSKFKVKYDNIKALQNLNKHEIIAKIEQNYKKNTITNNSPGYTYNIIKPVNAVISQPIPKVKPKKRTISGKVGICRICGKETSDWITYNGADKTCTCRECEYKDNEDYKKQNFD